MYRHRFRLLIAAACLFGSPLHAEPAGPADRSPTRERPAATGDAELAVTAGEQQFGVLTRPARGAGAARVLVLAVTDGAAAGAWTASEQLRASLPDHGWSTWLLGLGAPPLVRSATLGERPSAGPDTTGTPPPAETSAADTAPAADAQSPAPTPDEQRVADYRAWLAGSAERIAGTVAKAVAAHPDGVVLVGEGSAAAAVLAALPALQGDATALRGALIIEPVWPADVPAHWPRGLRTPALEILTPATQHREGAARSSEARTLELTQYRQFGIAFEGWAPDSGESVFAKRVRGWLERLDTATAVSADDGQAGQGAAPASQTRAATR